MNNQKSVTGKEIKKLFEKAWKNTIEMYQDERKILFKAGKYDYFPPSFYSEADLENIFVEKLRKEFNKIYKDNKIFVHTQFVIKPAGYEDSKKLYNALGRVKKSLESKSQKKYFIPDIMINTTSNKTNENILILAELKFWPNFNKESPNKKQLTNLEENLKNDLKQLEKKEFKQLLVSINENITKWAYICVLSDDLCSDDFKHYYEEYRAKFRKKSRKIDFLLGGIRMK